jgi:hypothetical protein
MTGGVNQHQAWFHFGQGLPIAINAGRAYATIFNLKSEPDGGFGLFYSRIFLGDKLLISDTSVTFSGQKQYLMSVDNH